MSFIFPYFGFPSFRRYYGKNPNVQKKEEPPKESSSKDNQNESRKAPETGYLFDLFGLHLNSDDILIIGVLFLLYTEGVKDQSLFISLIMLLLDR